MDAPVGPAELVGTLELTDFVVSFVLWFVFFIVKYYRSYDNISSFLMGDTEFIIGLNQRW